jgi:stringent starvation protein B
MFEPEAAYDEDVASLNDDEELPDSETVMSVIDGDKPDNHGDDPDDTPPPRGGVRRSRGEIAGNQVVIKSSSSKDGWIFL